MTALTSEDLQKIARDFFQYQLRCENEEFDLGIDGEMSLDEFKKLTTRKQKEIEDAVVAPNIDEADIKKWFRKFGFADVTKISEDWRVLEKYFKQAKAEAKKIAYAKLIEDDPKTVSQNPIFAGIIEDRFLSNIEISEKYYPGIPHLFGSDFGASPLGINLANAIADFVTHRKAHKSWGKKTEDETLRTFRWFAEIYGDDKPLKTFKSSDISYFVLLLGQAPAKAAQKVKTRSLLESIKLRKADMPLLNPKTVQKYLNSIHSFFKWAEDEGLIDKRPGKTVFVKDGSSKESDRMPFSQQELATIFTSPMFTGCKDKRHRRFAGDMIYKDAYYWILLILIFTGARDNEIVQTHFSDVRRIDDIWVFDVNNSGSKSLKTKSSRRKIPIHHNLLDWGFIEYMQSQAAIAGGELRIFHDLDAKNPSGAFSKFANRYMDKLGLNDPNLTMHSLRHSFEDACRTHKVHDSHRYQLTGHSEKGMGKNYGVGADVIALKSSIDSVTYNFVANFNAFPVGKEIITS